MWLHISVIHAHIQERALNKHQVSCFFSCGQNDNSILNLVNFSYFLAKFLPTKPLIKFPIFLKQRRLNLHKNSKDIWMMESTETKQWMKELQMNGWR